MQTSSAKKSYQENKFKANLKTWIKETNADHALKAYKIVDFDIYLQWKIQNS